MTPEKLKSVEKVAAQPELSLLISSYYVLMFQRNSAAQPPGITSTKTKKKSVCLFLDSDAVSTCFCPNGSKFNTPVLLCG